jgi:RNA binding exosome subunit
MSSVPLHYVELRAFCYATEDEDRVRAALDVFLPDEVDLQRAESEGHFGDPIVIFSTRLERADEIRDVLAALSELPDEEYDRVLAELEERVDEDCNLYLTLDKQAASKGEVRLGDGITLRGKVEAYPAKKPAAVENARELLEDR